MMALLSVNINKIATLRNSRGGNVPDLLKATVDCQRFGAQGITIHPRPDERHIRYSDTRSLRPLVTTEFNIEGNPIDTFIELVLEVVPEQVTLVPDTPEQLTSNAGWDTRKHAAFLREVIALFKSKGIRASIFVDTNLNNIRGAAELGCDRIELYTEPYAATFSQDKEAAVVPFVNAAEEAIRLGLGLNAGHDLSLENLRFFASRVKGLQEVSIGHALIADALYFGLENTIQLYRRQLES